MEAWIDTPAGRVRLAMTPAERSTPRGAVVLAHGAGSSMDHPALVALARAIGDAGFVTCRFDFPYRTAGRRLPDRLPALVATYRTVVERVRSDPALGVSWIAIGGRSLGGRVATHLAAAGVPVDALVLLSFPLHPAGRPSTTRAAHLNALEAPMLFVQGTRDALAAWDLLAPVVAALPQATLYAVDGGDHTLAVPKRRRDPAAVTAEIHAAVVHWLTTRRS